MAAISKNKAAAKRSATVRAKCICDCRVIAHDSLMRTLARCRADELIIEAEAQRRLADLRAKGAIPGDKDWREAPPPRPASETPVKGRGSLLWRRASSVTAVVSNMQKKLEKDSEGDSESDTPTRSRSSSLGGR